MFSWFQDLMKCRFAFGIHHDHGRFYRQRKILSIDNGFKFRNLHKRKSRMTMYFTLIFSMPYNH